MSIGPPSLPVVDDCWNRIGVNGDRTCPELEEHVHCRNCPVFARAARGFFDRRAPDGYLAEWADLLGRPVEAGKADDQALLVFRLGGEWLALSLSSIAEVTAPRPVHKVPHRSNRVFSGLVSLRGQLQLCVSLHGLLEVTPADPAVDPSPNHRLVVIRQGSETWAFPAEEVSGVHRVALESLAKSPRRCPTPLAASAGPCSPGRGAERRRPRRGQGLRGAAEDGGMSDDLSGFSLMDLFRSEADGQIALMTEGLLALEGEAAPSASALESLMRAAHSLKGRRGSSASTPPSGSPTRSRMTSSPPRKAS